MRHEAEAESIVAKTLRKRVASALWSFLRCRVEDLEFPGVRRPWSSAYKHVCHCRITEGMVGLASESILGDIACMYRHDLYVWRYPPLLLSDLG